MSNVLRPDVQIELALKRNPFETRSTDLLRICAAALLRRKRETDRTRPTHTSPVLLMKYVKTT